MKRNVSTIAYILSLSGLLTLAGCQTTPQQNSKPSKSVEKPKSEQPDHRVATPDGVKITPYERPEIKREKVPVVIAPQSKPQTQKFEDGENIPAFKQLIQQTQTAYQKGQWDEAERYAIHAQRLAPQSAQVFSYLAQIANQKKQYANAESLARRGLSYAQSPSQKKTFWNVILQAAQQLKSQQSIAEAQKQLQRL